MTRHQETRLLPYRPEDLFALVTDIERYPEFLPWCAAVRILSGDETEMRAEMVVRYKALSERFISRVMAIAPAKVEVTQLEGPFSHLFNRWEFKPHPQGAEVDFTIEFAFRSSVLEKLMGYFFHSAFRKMVSAFEARAKEKYSRVSS